MSLINRVLRELDRRQAAPASSRPLPAGVQPTQRIGKRGRWRRVVLLFLAIASVGGAAWWVVQSGPGRSDRAQLSGLPPSPAATFTRAPPPALTSAAQTATLAGTPTPGTPPGESLPKLRTAAPSDLEAQQPAPARGVKAAAPAPARVAEAPDLQVNVPEEPALDTGVPLTEAEAAFRRGLALYRKQQPGEAEQAWRTALALEPGHDLARRALANLLIREGDRDGAEQLLADGLYSHPDQLRVALMLAQLQIGRGGWREALKTLEAGLPYAQGNAAYLAATAELKARAGQHAEAARLFEAALRIAPDNAEWTIALGLALQADGRTDDAYEVLRRARGLKSLDPQQRELIERKLRQLGG